MEITLEQKMITEGISWELNPFMQTTRHDHRAYVVLRRIISSQQQFIMNSLPRGQDKIKDQVQ